MPVPEIVSAAVGTYVGIKFDQQTLLALAISIIVFYLLVTFAERIG